MSQSTSMPPPTALNKSQKRQRSSSKDATSSSSQPTAGPMDKFIHKKAKTGQSTFQRSFSSSSALDHHCGNFLQSPLPNRKGSTKKINDITNKSVYGMLFSSKSFDSKAEAVVGLGASDNELRKFKEKTPSKPVHAPRLALPVKDGAPTRKIETEALHSLSAPGLVNDYYSNVLDWSKSELVAIALNNTIHFYNAKTGFAFPLDYDFDTDIGALAFRSDGRMLAVGCENNEVHLFDVKPRQNKTVDTHLVELKKTLRGNGQDGNINALAWNPVRLNLLTVGTDRGVLLHHDVQLPHTLLKKVTDAHDGDVCGLKWRNDGQYLASGGNDALVKVWGIRSLSAPSFVRERHISAVRALAWCPWNSDLLASGGGRDDKKIHIWNIKTGVREMTFDAGSQVTSIHWSKHYRELVSTHGAPNHYISIWSYTKDKRLIDIPAHESRVLHAVMNPNGQKLATVATDEKLKFWDIFSSDKAALPDESIPAAVRRKHEIAKIAEQIR
ncbi:WD40-repeat-containing domain protein [Mycotypha africana]|uniref:WD40-repeat-containing domain protein n=1 Tax=Mycotypha africana TaxID=64632 RepID=UPI002300E54C|nr:WD40-repeat-containing domain protein [Mycotypha africana]KAI8984255.1 WD40-repeat-containing domain protein [Mycotypha africana]